MVEAQGQNGNPFAGRGGSVVNAVVEVSFLLALASALLLWGQVDKAAVVVGIVALVLAVAAVVRWTGHIYQPAGQTMIVFASVCSFAFMVAALFCLALPSTLGMVGCMILATGTMLGALLTAVRKGSMQLLDKVEP